MKKLRFVGRSKQAGRFCPPPSPPHIILKITPMCLQTENIHMTWIISIFYAVAIKAVPYRPRVAQRVPGSYGSQISWQRHRMVVSCQPYAPAAFIPRKFYWYSFLLEAESNPGPWCDRKDFMSKKNSNDTSWDRTSDLPICSTAPSQLYHRCPTL
jgi:hypothetical protein